MSPRFSNIKRTAFRAIFATSFVACGVGLCLAGPFDVPSFEIHRDRSPASAPGSSSVQVIKQPLRLNYQNTSWENVLQDVTKTSGHTLIMKEAPSRRFSRRDGNQYSFNEAVRVLNHELEKEGYRLLEQENYLILIKLEQVRTQYERSSIPQAIGESTKQSLPKTPLVSYPRKVATVTPSLESIQQDSFTSGAPQAPTPVPSNNPFFQPEPTVTLSSPVESTKPQQESPPSRFVRSVVPTRHAASNIARLLHEGFGKNSKLVTAGPRGLPAFVVSPPHKTKTDSSFQFAVGIDIQNNQLVVEGPELATEEIEQTIQLIQASADEGQETVKIVPSSVDVEKLAKSLEPSMNRLFALQAQQANQNPDVQPIPINAVGNPLGTELRSNVTVQAMPDLGVLILSGNEKDVEAVMAVIAEIEKLSVGTAPGIQLLILSHVDSTQLSILLSSVYEDLTSRKPGATPETPQSQPERSKVTFIPVTKPNALLILAPEADIPSILELAEELDQPVDPLTEFEVFALKNAIATQAATLLTDFFEDRESLGGSISAFADVRTNSLIVRARPRDLEEAAALIQKIDKDASGAVNLMKVIPLKNGVAQEVADVINQALQSLQLPQGQDNQFGGAGAFNLGGTGESSTQLREIKSLALEFLSTDGDQDKLLRSGILADIRITADSRINSLIVIAPTRSMVLMEAFIRKLDQIPTSVAEIKIFTLRNSDATQAVELLTSLFAQTTTTGGANGQQQAQGVQIAGATDVSNTLVSLRFSADVRTNSVIAVGGADSLKVVEAMLLRLDEDDVRQRQTTVIKLKNSPAADVAEAINQFLDSQRELAEAQPDLISNIELLEQEIIVVPEAVTNSLLVSATPRYFSIIQNMVARLDESPPQVIIQALLVEVGLENTDEFGIELGLQDSLLFDRSLIDAVTGALAPGFQFNSPNLGGGVNDFPGNVGAQSLSNFGVGRSNSDLGFGGLVLSASSENISVLIRALAARRNVHVLSRPQIRTLDNQQAQIQVGQQVPIVDGVTVTAQGTSNPNVSQEDVGLILTVRPRINPDGTIVMETAAVKSQLSGDGVPIFVNTDGSVIESPIIDITSASATVSVSNGQTIVLGGIITEKDETIERKVPWLGDVPIVGRAFRYDSTNSLRSELLIFLTPRIILNGADSEFIKQVETERTHINVEQAEDVHGPLFGVPPVQHQYPLQNMPLELPVELPVDQSITPINYEVPAQPKKQAGELSTFRRKPTPAANPTPPPKSSQKRFWPFPK